MLPTRHNHFVLEFENDAAVNVEGLTVSHPDIVMNAYHATLVIGERVLQFGFECSFRLGAIPSELIKHGIAPDAVAGNRAQAGRMLRDVLIEELSERIHVGSIKSVVSPTVDFGVLMHGLPPESRYIRL